MSFEGVEKYGTAWDNLQTFLRPGEVVEAVCFGNWGANCWVRKPSKSNDDHDPPLIPVDKRGVLLTLDEAKPLMQSDKWAFSGGYGGADCFAVFVWTNQRVIFVHEYDGATGLTGVPRNPTTDEFPHVSGDDPEPKR